jgi:hypothetical protein
MASKKRGFKTQYEAPDGLSPKITSIILIMGVVSVADMN